MKIAKILGAMVLAAVVIGCDEKKPAPTGGNKPAGGAKEDNHVHGKGPNGGIVFDLGKYHGELKIDHDKKEMTIFMLGADEKTPTAIACKELTVTTKEAKAEKGGAVVKSMTIKLTPKDEKDGKATTFSGTDPGLATEAEHEGAVTGVIDGKPAKGEFKEE